MKPKSHWIVTADERRAVLYACVRAEGSRWTPTEMSAITTTWDDVHEHHRPSVLGRGPTSNASQHFASHGHDDEEAARRFALDVRIWLTDLQKNHHAERMDLIAPARFLGVLREALGAMAHPPEFHEAELMRLTPAQLAAHPLVLRALSAPAAAR